MLTEEGVPVVVVEERAAAEVIEVLEMEIQIAGVDQMRQNPQAEIILRTILGTQAPDIQITLLGAYATGTGDGGKVVFAVSNPTHANGQNSSSLVVTIDNQASSRKINQSTKCTRSYITIRK